MSPATLQTAVIHLRHPEVDCWNFGPREMAVFKDRFPELEAVVCASEAEFVSRLPGADLALTWRFCQEWFAQAPRLRVVATPAAGRDQVRVQPPPSVSVLNGRFHGRIIGETVLGALLGMTRGILPAATTFSSDPWPQEALGQRMRTLRDARVTILGFGHIGACIARLLKGFAAVICGIRRQPPARLPDFFTPGDRILPLEHLDAVLPQTDHLVMVLPGDTGTDGIINRERLAALPAHATLCNVGRGNALDETALAEALNNDRLAGAFLDVFAREPLPKDSPLRRVKNLWRLPHASAIGPDYLLLFLDDLREQLAERTRSKS